MIITRRVTHRWFGHRVQNRHTDCLSDSYDENEEFYTKLAVMSAAPLIFFVGSSLCWGVVAIVKKSLGILKNELVGSGVILFVLLHPSVLRVLFAALHCEEMKPGEFWVTGLEVKCWEGRHLTYALAVALPALVIWGVGVPGLILCSIVIQRKRLRDLSVKIRFGYLFSGFTESQFYWEFVVIYRRFLIIVIVTFCSQMSKMAQALMALSVLLLALLLHHHSKPYSHISLNIMENRSLLVSIATIFFGLFYLDDSLNSAVSYICFALILGFNVYFLQYWLFKMFATYLVLLVKKVSWLQRYLVVENEGTVISHSRFVKKAVAYKQRLTLSQRPLIDLSKRLYMQSLLRQTAHFES